jgi:hypothetical protein
MKTTLLNSFFCSAFLPARMAQNIKGKIIDAKPGKHSLCQHKSKRNRNLVSNAEGYFMLSENNSRDETVLSVSYLGFVNRQLTVSELKDLIIVYY